MTDPDIDFSIGNWIALNGGPEEIDRWNRLVGQIQSLERERNDLRDFCKGIQKNINNMLKPIGDA